MAGDIDTPQYQSTQSSNRSHTSQDESIGRVVPHSIQAEACVLGSMTFDQAAIDVVVQALKEEHFYRPAHQLIYRAMVEMHDGERKIDLVTLLEELATRGQLEQVGGRDYVVELAMGVPSAANVEYYTQIVRDKAMLRKLIRAGQQIVADAFDSSDEPAVVIDRAEQEIFDIAQMQISDSVSNLKELLQSTFEIIQEQEGKAITGLATGYTQLDELTAGFQSGEMLILAARPSMGKTALLLNIAEYMSVVDEKPIAFFSLEMSRMQIAQRLLASHAQFDLRNMRRATISPEHWTNLQTAAGNLENARFLIDDSSTLTSLQLRAKARRLKAQHDISCIFVDYLQLMSYSGRADSRQEQIAEMSRSIKALARELDIPVLCAAQLNRSPADRPTHTPRMSDLRESGSIEQDADVVMLLHNEDYYHRGEEGYVPTGVTKLIVEKQRNGPTGVVSLIFRPECTRFEQAAPGYIQPQG